MIAVSTFEEMISSLDTGLYKSIEAELSEEDRKSLLAIQSIIRKSKDRYCYLEIGSHLGGSIQPYLLDPRCYRIYSIDKRPLIQPDDRGMHFEYPDNSTEKMLARLNQISESGTSKILCFDSDAKEIAPTSLSNKPDICFIDGEHTSQAVISDFNFCFSVINTNGLICFHDSEIVWKGLETIIAKLKARNIEFNFSKLGGSVSVISFNDPIFDKEADLHDIVSSSWKYFLFHQKLAKMYKSYFNHKFVNVLKPWFKLALNTLRRHY